jgi:hypothetical protein
VKCRNCSAEIAEKAIVCYRCGTPTADLAEVPRHAPPAARGRFALIIVLVVVAVALALYVVFSGRAAAAGAPAGHRGLVPPQNALSTPQAAAHVTPANEPQSI